GALEAYHRELPIRERLARERPDDPASQVALQTLRSDIADLLTESGRLDEAQGLFESQADAWERLTRAFPDDVAVNDRCAEFHANWARLLGEYRGRIPEAIQHAERAEATLERLTQAHPQRLRSRQRRAAVLYHLSLDESGQGHVERALRRSEQANELLEALRRDQPDDQEVRVLLASNLGQLAHLLTAQDRGGEALRHVRDSIAALEQFVRDRPNVVEYRLRLASSYIGLSDLWAQAGRPAAALEELRKSLALTERLAR